MAEPQSFIQQMYEAFVKRTRIFVRSGTEFQAADNAVVLSAKLTANAQGVITLDYSASKLQQLYDVTLQPISASKNAVDKIDAVLVGEPTLTGLTIQTYKPLAAVLGAVSLQIAAAATVYVVVRGRV